MSKRMSKLSMHTVLIFCKYHFINYYGYGLILCDDSIYVFITIDSTNCITWTITSRHHSSLWWPNIIVLQILLLLLFTSDTSNNEPNTINTLDSVVIDFQYRWWLIIFKWNSTNIIIIAFSLYHISLLDISKEVITDIQ